MGIEFNTKLNRFTKDKRLYINLLIIFILFFFLTLTINKNNDYNRTSLQPIDLKRAKINIDHKKLYSKWPNFTFNSLSHLNKYVQKKCVNNELEVSIENFDSVIELWKRSDDSTCKQLYDIFTLIYEINIHKTNLFMSDQLVKKVREWLGNDDNLVKQAATQKLIIIYNRFTNEENAFNPLRQKKPQKKPEVSPDVYYKKTMDETSKSCDFCSEENTAYSSIGRLKTQYSYTASNLFPFDSPHELLLPRKHDLLELTYEEFNDMFKLSTKYFEKVYQSDKSLKYPTLLWDFLYKGGASQTHPHLHLTVNPDRYYSSFEAIRSGAETYFKETNRNYFNDFAMLHMSLGLSFVHKSSLIIFSLTPKKDYDAIILSDSFDDSVIEIIYVILKSYILNLNIYPFSMSCYYPSMDSFDNKGRIPLYCKIIPRGDISTIRSDISTLELMSTFNSNLDQFKLATSMNEMFQNKFNDFKF